MSMVLNIAEDGAVFDGWEPVSFRAAGADETTLLDALRRRDVAAEAAPSDGKHVSQDVVWHLKAADLPAPPALGSVVTDADEHAWTVLRVESAALGSRWRCSTRNLAISGNLEEFVTIQKATWSRDAHGAPVAGWHDYRVGVRARVQPQSGETETDQQQHQTRRTYKVYLAERIPIDESCRVLRGGAIYRVLSYERPERIDRLLVVNVELET